MSTPTLPTDHEEYEALAVAWALDALEPADLAIFEAHRDGCGRCTRAAYEALETAAELAYAVADVSPPPRLRERVLAAALPHRPNGQPPARYETGALIQGRPDSGPASSDRSDRLDSQPSHATGNDAGQSKSRPDGDAASESDPMETQPDGRASSGDNGRSDELPAAGHHGWSEERTQRWPAAGHADGTKDPSHERPTAGHADRTDDPSYERPTAGHADWTEDPSHERPTAGHADGTQARSDGPPAAGHHGWSEGRSHGQSAADNDDWTADLSDGPPAAESGGWSEGRSHGQSAAGNDDWTENRSPWRTTAGDSGPSEGRRVVRDETAGGRGLRGEAGRRPKGAGPGRVARGLRGSRRLVYALAATVLAAGSAITTWEVIRPAPVTEQIAALSAGNGTVATVVARQHGADVVTDVLPPNTGRGTAYYLWGVPAEDGGTPQVVGTFQVTATGLHSYPLRLTRSLDGYPVLAISEEKAGSTPSAPSSVLGRGALGG